MFRVSCQEALLVVSPIIATRFTRGKTCRWMVAILVVYAFAVACKPADPVSTLFAAIPIMLAFTLGVVPAPLMRHASL